MIKKFGIQAWTVRDLMPADDAQTTAQTFKKLAEYGYSELQTIKLNLPAEEYAALARESGLDIVGTHSSFDDLIADPEKAIETHKILNCTNVGIGSMPGYARENKEAVYAFCDKVNEFAKTISRHGLKFTYHNHSFEFMKIDGDRTVFDILIERFDPETISFCLDTYWVQHGGGDVRGYIEKLAGRIDIIHFKDMEMCNDGVQRYTSVGNGNLDFKLILEAAEKAGVKHYVVEQDSFWVDNDPMKAAKNSADYIKANLM